MNHKMWICGFMYQSNGSVQIPSHWIFRNFRFPEISDFPKFTISGGNLSPSPRHGRLELEEFAQRSDPLGLWMQTWTCSLGPFRVWWEAAGYVLILSRFSIHFLNAACDKQKANLPIKCENNCEVTAYGLRTKDFNDVQKQLKKTDVSRFSRKINGLLMDF